MLTSNSEVIAVGLNLFFILYGSSLPEIIFSENCARKFL